MRREVRETTGKDAWGYGKKIKKKTPRHVLFVEARWWLQEEN